MPGKLKDLRITVFTIAIATIAAVMSATIFVPIASAQCGYFEQHNAPPSIWQKQSRPRQPALRPASFLLVSNQGDNDSDNMSIVGFWKVKFVAEGNNGTPPDGTVIDNGLAQWHSDGTEIMNSGARQPVTGNYCLGVWKKIGGSTYKLNHFALSFDASGTFVGPANIREEVTVDHGGNTFGGTFTIDQYESTGTTVIGHVEGTIAGIRITPDTSVGDVF